MSARARPALVALAVIVTACGGPVLANPPARPPVATARPLPTPRPAGDPLPVRLPRDDAPHGRVSEWWYYTGHVNDETRARWGFELVMFRGQRGDFPVTWAAHLALTDEDGGTFTYAQRGEIGAQVDRSARTGDGFDLAISGLDLSVATARAPDAWEMVGRNGRDRLTAAAAEAETRGDRRSFALDLRLAAARPPTLHDQDGWIDTGPAGGSYYYSRTRLDADGSIVVDGRALRVDGAAWFDHQWGDFIAVGAGGWDWFAVNLSDGTDLMLYLVRDRRGTYPLVSGTVTRADGTVRHLPRGAFAVDVTGRWTSPTTGIEYPAGWRIEVPDEDLVIDLVPTVGDQELDTRDTTGVVYWEGSQRVVARRGTEPLSGEAYVELTGYGSGSPP